MNVRVDKPVNDLWHGYGHDQPLPDFAFISLGNLLLLVTLAKVAQGRRYSVFRFSDLILLIVGTHKLARLIAKDRVTAPVRAAFTEFERPSGSGEVEERVRGKGLQQAIGELISCPYCMSVWVAIGLTFLFTVDRRLARFLCEILTGIAGAHFLHRVYQRLEPK